VLDAVRRTVTSDQRGDRDTAGGLLELRFGMAGLDRGAGVHGGSVEMQPVTISLQRRPEELLAEKVDAIELMEDALENGVGLVRAHLMAEVIDLIREWWDDVEHASHLVTYAAAHHLAKEGSGLIRDDQEEWWDVRPPRPTRVAW